MASSKAMSGLIDTSRIVPKVLFRLNKGTSISLRDRTVKPRGLYDLTTENGMVKPKALDPQSYRAPNGASLRPKTKRQQRSLREQKSLRDMAASDYLVYTIPAATQLPDDLILVHERYQHYSLQPAKLMSLQDLNTKITDFLDTRAEKLTREQWLEKYTKATEPPLT